MNRDKVIVKNNPKSPVAEAYRTLRTNIQFSNIDETLKTILLTSPGPSEGKSTTVVNLAVSIAQNDKKVLLVDSDLRKPKIHTYFDVLNARGLTTALAQNIDYKELVQDSGIKNLEILASGPIPPNPSELLGSNKMKKLIERMKEEYDMVLFDSPPVGLVTDAAVLSTVVDGVILVCAVGQAVIDAARNAKFLLQKVNANILGVVLNKIPVNESGYYRYHYYHYYYADEEENKAGTKRKRRKRQQAAESL